MNTIRSTWYGWGTLLAAGGGAYYFAKRSINADRAARHEADISRKRLLSEMEASETASKVPPNQKIATPSPSNPSQQRQNQNQSQNNRAKTAAVNETAGRDDVGSPSAEACQDPAPTRHEPLTDEQRVNEKSKYEASEKFKPIKGNRLS